MQFGDFNSTSEMSGPGLQIRAFRLRISHFRFWNLGFQIKDITFLIPDSRLETPGTSLKIADYDLQTTDQAQPH